MLRGIVVVGTTHHAFCICYFRNKEEILSAKMAMK